MWGITDLMWVIHMLVIQLNLSLIHRRASRDLNCIVWDLFYVHGQSPTSKQQDFKELQNSSLCWCTQCSIRVCDFASSRTKWVTKTTNLEHPGDFCRQAARLNLVLVSRVTGQWMSVTYLKIKKETVLTTILTKVSLPFHSYILWNRPLTTDISVPSKLSIG